MRERVTPSPRSRAVTRYGSEFPPMTLFTDPVGYATVEYAVRPAADDARREAALDRARRLVASLDGDGSDGPANLTALRAALKGLA